MNKISLKALNIDTTSLFKENNAICVCGNENHYNGLTIGWGSLGILWRKEIATVYIKPNRYTYEFACRDDFFSIMWFDEPKRKEVIKTFGTLSGRNVDKEAMCNLTKVMIDNCVCYEEASLIITCKKIHEVDLGKGLIYDKDAIARYYEDEPVHKQFIGEIIGVYKK